MESALSVTPWVVGNCVSSGGLQKGGGAGGLARESCTWRISMRNDEKESGASAVKWGFGFIHAYFLPARGTNSYRCKMERDDSLSYRKSYILGDKCVVAMQ